MRRHDCLECHWPVRLQQFLSGLVLTVVLEMSFEARCLLQHPRWAAVDQSGLKVVWSGLLLLLVVLWFQQLGNVSFQRQLLDWTLILLLQPVWLEKALKDPRGAEERAGHQLLMVPCLGQLLNLFACPKLESGVFASWLLRPEAEAPCSVGTCDKLWSGRLAPDRDA